MKMKRVSLFFTIFLVFAFILSGCNGVTAPEGVTLKAFQDNEGFFSLLVPNDVKVGDVRHTEGLLFIWLKSEKHSVMISLVNVEKEEAYNSVTDLSSFVQTILQEEQNFVQNLNVITQPATYKDGMMCKISFTVGGETKTTLHFDKKISETNYIDLEVGLEGGVDESVFSQIVDSLKVLKTL